MKRSVVAYVTACVGALACACAPEATLDPGTLAPVRVAVVTSLSGGLGTDGPGWRDASRLVAHEVNAAGGVGNGRPLELVVLDDATDVDPDATAALGERVLGEGVVGVVGAAASGITLGMANVLTPAQIPQVSCCSTSDLITQFNEALAPEARFLFRTSAPDRLQARVVSLAATDRGCTNLAILHLDDSYGQHFGEAIEAAWRAAGGTVSIRVSYTENEPSYASEVAMVRDAVPAPDCIALVAFPRSGGTILRDWLSAGGYTTITWIGTDGVRSPGFVEEVGDPTLIRNFYGTSPITDAATPAYNAFRDRFESVFGSTPIPFSSNQYDATALMALAIARASAQTPDGSVPDGPAIRDALREVANPNGERTFVRAGDLASALAELQRGNDVDYDGASGNTNFDAVGNVVTPYEIWRFDGPAVPPCATSTLVAGMQGSFCRFRTLSAEEIEP